MNFLFVMIGGAIGAMSRYLVGLMIQKKFPNPPMPIAMVIVNIVGSFGLGFVTKSFSFEKSTTLYDESFYLLISIGFFAAFTTFSTFSVETLQLLLDHKLKTAMLYLVVTILLAIFFFTIGFTIG